MPDKDHKSLPALEADGRKQRNEEAQAYTHADTHALSHTWTHLHPSAAVTDLRAQAEATAHTLVAMVAAKMWPPRVMAQELQSTAAGEMGP